MDIQVLLNSIDAILVIGVGLPSLYVAWSVRQPKLRLLAGLLSGFLLLHGLYHLTAVLATVPGMNTLGSLSDLLVEPLGWLVFLTFAVYLWRYSE